jgi:putative transposase
LCIPRARKKNTNNTLTTEFSIFNRWQRFQDDLLDAILQAYLMGNTSRDVTELAHHFCGTSCSREFVRKLLENFNDKLQDYLNRTISHQWPFLFIDGMRIRIKEGLKTKDRVVIWALGFDNDGNRSILGFFIAHSESAIAVESLLKDLYRRGLKKPSLIICDEAQAIINAASDVFLHTDIQVCTLHKLKSLSRNLAKNTDLSRKKRNEIVKCAAKIYDAPTKTVALNRFMRFKKKYRHLAKQPIDCFEVNFNRTLTYYNFDPDIQKSIKTNNLIERMNRAARFILRKYLYFHEKNNARMALFTFVCRYEQKYSKTKDAVSLSFLELAA